MSERKGQTIQCQKEKDKQYNVRKKRTINTMSERKGQTIQCPKEKDKQYNVRKKRTRRQTMVDKTLLRKLKIGNTNLTKNRDEFSCYGRVDSSCFTSGTHHS
jgi:hypothetical protein